MCGVGGVGLGLGLEPSVGSLDVSARLTRNEAGNGDGGGREHVIGSQTVAAGLLR